MKITARHIYDAEPTQVHAMLTDPAWLGQVAQKAGATSHEASVNGDLTTLTVSLPSPEQARRFTGDNLIVHVKTRWAAPSADGERKARMSIEVEKMPAQMTGAVVLWVDDEKTTVDYAGDLVVNIPFIGKALESTAAPHLMSVLNVQQDVGNEWLNS